jgi:hypothetical protein
LTVLVDGEAELTTGEYVSGDFFRGIALSPGAGRLLSPEDDRAGAPPVAVIHAGYAERRFGSIGTAVGRSILVNNTPFTVVGVTPAAFDGIDPGITTGLYLPLEAGRAFDTWTADAVSDPNWCWAGIMGRLQDGVTRDRPERALSGPFAQWERRPHQRRRARQSASPSSMRAAAVSTRCGGSTRSRSTCCWRWSA